MSKKSIFKKKKKSERKDVALIKRKEKTEKLTEEYQMKSDFITLGIIISIFLLILVGIYYYNQQNNILITLYQTLVDLFN
ncbi:hypothetical protein KAJ41_02345 [Candidatus Parcubacteria bacterium]|nr:hypothetical protein [Candidatus Parcubacteria bacterium]